MKAVILSAIFLILSTSAFAKDNDCEPQFAAVIQNLEKASDVAISSDDDLGPTKDNQGEHYYVLAYYSDEACQGDSQTFQVYTKKGSCEVRAIHADGDEDCGD